MIKALSPLYLELNDKIKLPQPEKFRIILEIASDMEAYYDQLISSGVAQENAITTIRDEWFPSDQALQELISLHQGFYSRLAQRFSKYKLSIFEKSIISFLLCFICFTVYKLFNMSTLFSTSPAIWLQFTLTIPLIVFILFKGFQLYLKRDHQLKNLSQGLVSILFFSILIFLTGLSAYYLEWQYTLFKIAEHPNLWFENLILLFKKTTPLMIYGITCILIGGTAWFSLLQKTNKIRQYEFDVLFFQ